MPKIAKGRYDTWITPEGQALLRGWKRSGMTDEKIADKIGIAVGTLYEWKNRFPEINDALKKGKEVCDFETEEALIGLFEGHYVEDTVTEINESDGIQKKHIRKTKRWIEPNVTAIIFYLKCRAGWREQSQDDAQEVLDKLAEMISSVEKEAHERVKAEP